MSACRVDRVLQPEKQGWKRAGSEEGCLASFGFTGESYFRVGGADKGQEERKLLRDRH